MWKFGSSNDLANQPRTASRPRSTPDGVSYIGPRNGDTNSTSSASIPQIVSRSWRFHAVIHSSTKRRADSRSTVGSGSSATV